MNNRLGLHFWNFFATCLRIFLSLVFLALLVTGLRRYRCGQYTDGPGSITPCINYTDELHLKECLPQASGHCIKYVNEASTVRYCADECNEKRSGSWGTSIYCCSGDVCNSAASEWSSVIMVAIASTSTIWNHFRLLSRLSHLSYFRKEISRVWNRLLDK